MKKDHDDRWIVEPAALFLVQLLIPSHGVEQSDGRSYRVFSKTLRTIWRAWWEMLTEFIPLRPYIMYRGLGESTPSHEAIHVFAAYVCMCSDGRG